jgi:isoleucyl-tRNA synthetase
MLYHKKWQKYVFPGGKIEKGDTIENTVKKELNEELNINVTSIKHLWSFKEIMPYGLFNLNIIDVEFTGEPENKEPEKHTHSIRAEIIPSDNKLWFAIKIESTIVDDDFEIMNQFYDLYIYQKNIAQQVTEIQWKENADMNVLAWTTTPWTLPSNMFLAVGKHIHYYIVFDKNSKEYYIIAENLMKQYYKDDTEYILINIIQWEILVGRTYEPLFQHINNSKIEKKYKEQFFKIIPGEFVSTEDGTGIVHIAPAFGGEDFNAVAQFMPREFAKDRLFLPVNDYGEFTDEVPERKGMRVYDANKDIIQRLKEEGKLIGQRSYEHSYPHCRRCDTPLISKALTSWFIKEPSLTPLTVPNAEKIGFVPEWVKKRFIDVLKTAPDWNLARNRYRWAPIPVRENTKKPEDIMVCGTLEEIYQGTRIGSQNITKNIIIRHGKTVYNETRTHDSYSRTTLNKEGQKQAKKISKYLNTCKKEDRVLIITPLERTLETSMPFIEKQFPDTIQEIKEKYKEIQNIYQKLRDSKELQSYLQDSSKQHLFPINERIYVDFRTTDIIVPELQDKPFIQWLTTSKPTNEKLMPESESMDQVIARCKAYTVDVNEKFKTKTIITVTHKDSVILIQKTFKDFDYLTKKQEYIPDNGQMVIRYRDNDRKAEMDLHKPYVDNYRFKKWTKEYRRIPEVMDCRFESWSMPFGQCGYTWWVQSSKSKVHKVGNEVEWWLSTWWLIYPADFIMEGLDQTRGWFRGMHVCGNAVMKKNSFNNVIINGLVLAEDGKKMSKKLNNYPDPEYLFGRYGTDAYRLYLLASPAVRAEPVRFSEKGVDQIYKDFTASILNAYKFFETYANVDKWTTDNTNCYYMRTTDDTMQNMLENILRINPDIIYTNDKKNAEEISEIMKTYRNKKIKTKDLETEYTKILKKNPGKNIILLGDEITGKQLWKDAYGTDISLEKWETIKLPTYTITNELDKWILAELHSLGIQIEQEMDRYFLDNGAKLVLWFIEKLNNRFIRRSRRRFRASGMDNDKRSAFNTLFEVLQNYMKICASFAPFISEHIYLELQKFTTQGKQEGDSIHLQHLPLFSEKYIDKQLLEEIEVVRKIISLGLFIRSKNKIAVKQPLAKMQIRL